MYSLTGLVAVTAGCGVIDYWAALVIGIIAGWVYIVVDAKLIEYKIDDAVSAIPVHLGGGLWGVFSAGLFAVPDLLTDAYGVATYPGLFYTETGKNLVPAQMVGALFIIGWTMITMVPFFLILNYMGLFRVNELEELIGLDASYDTTKPLRLDEGSETSDEMLRFAAYRQRLYEKRLLLDSSNNQVVEPMSAKQLLSNYLEEEKAKTVAHAKKHHTNHTRSRKRSQSLESIEASMVPTVSTAMELHTSSDTMGTFDLESP